MIALIDADIVAYRVGFTTEEEPEAIAAWRADELMQSILAETGATEYKAFLTGEGNFRRKVNALYKANRTKPKPVHLPFLTKHLVEKWGAVVVNGMEADDYLAINQEDNTIICSIDKDLLTVPGKHYNFVKKEFVDIDYLTGLRKFYKQFLIGDVADNIIGIKGIGPVGASGYIDHLYTELEMFNIVRELYNDDDRLLMNGICLYMKRTLDDDWTGTYNFLLGETN